MGNQQGGAAKEETPFDAEAFVDENIQQEQAATAVQASFRGKKTRSDLETHTTTGPDAEAATKMQAAVRGHQEREHLDQAKKVEVFSQNHAAKVIQRHTIAAQDKIKMLRECQDVLEKQGRKLAAWKWEMVVWQERFVKVTQEGIVYQHLDSKGEPKGKEKSIPFSSMEMIKALLGDILYLKCTKREYQFQCAGPVECERWATNLVLLAQYSGYTVPGYVVMAPEGDDDGKAPPDIASADGEGATGYAENYESAA